MLLSGNEVRQDIELVCRTFLLQQVFSALPPDFPHLRELRIQNAKLLTPVC